MTNFFLFVELCIYEIWKQCHYYPKEMFTTTTVEDNVVVTVASVPLLRNYVQEFLQHCSELEQDLEAIYLEFLKDEQIVEAYCIPKPTVNNIPISVLLQFHYELLQNNKNYSQEAKYEFSMQIQSKPDAYNNVASHFVVNNNKIKVKLIPLIQNFILLGQT